MCLKPHKKPFTCNTGGAPAFSSLKHFLRALNNLQPSKKGVTLSTFRNLAWFFFILHLPFPKKLWPPQMSKTNLTLYLEKERWEFCTASPEIETCPCISQPSAPAALITQQLTQVERTQEREREKKSFCNLENYRIFFFFFYVRIFLRELELFKRNGKWPLSGV